MNKKDISKLVGLLNKFDNDVCVCNKGGTCSPSCEFYIQGRDVECCCLGKVISIIDRYRGSLSKREV